MFFSLTTMPKKIRTQTFFERSQQKKMSNPVIWPACTYMDGVTPVELPEAEEDPVTKCPVAWSDMFRLHKRQRKFPYMYSKLMNEGDQRPVARAFRNYMQWVFRETK